MLYIIISIVLGIGVGAFVRHEAFLKLLAKTMRPLVLLLLFVMGIHLGTDDTAWSRLGSFGWSAAVVAVCSVAGSIAAAYLYQCIPRRKSGEKR